MKLKKEQFGGKEIPSNVDVTEKMTGLDENLIHCIYNYDDLKQHMETLLNQHVFGFDTETKVIWKNDKSKCGDKPDVIQLATNDYTYIFSLGNKDVLNFLAKIIENDKIQKVGFGLKHDIKKLKEKFNINPNNIVDVGVEIEKTGYGDINHRVGINAATKILFNKRTTKNRRVSCSNWSKVPLTCLQKRYAANDAYFSLLCFNELDRL